MRLLPLALLAAAVLAASVGPADAKKKSSYCAKAVKELKGKVKARSGGVVFFLTGKTINVCSAKYKKTAGLTSLDDGQKFASAKAVRSRCIAIYVKGSSKASSEMQYADFVKDVGTAVQEIAYPDTGGTVLSYSVSKNCALAWGQSVPAGRSIQLVSNGPFNNLTRGLHYTVATVDSDDDLKAVKATAKGKDVKVTWKQDGKKQSQVYPPAAE